MPSEKDLLIQFLIKEGFLKTPLIIKAFEKIDRKDFVPKDVAGEAYGNYPLSLGHGQTISQPLTVAFMLELLEPKRVEKILDVGSGSGWTTALLAEIVGARGRIFAFERIPELCKFGEANIGKYGFIEKGMVKTFCGDATSGLPEEAPFDKVLAGAAAQEKIPDAWKEQLKVGGRIVAPVGQSIIVLDKISEKEFEEREYFGFSFVPLIRG